MPKVKRFFLEIKRSEKKNQSLVFHTKAEIYLKKEKDININKFFY